MAWWMAVPLALQAGGAVMNAIGGINRSKRMIDAAGENFRRVRAEQEAVVGKTQAAQAASGVEADSSSLQTYLTTMTNEFKRQRDWMYREELRGANDVRTSSLIQGLTGLGSAVNSFAAANNYFKTPAPTTPEYVPGFGMPPWRPR